MKQGRGAPLHYQLNDDGDKQRGNSIAKEGVDFDPVGALI